VGGRGGVPADGRAPTTPLHVGALLAAHACMGLPACIAEEVPI
jgi:hypothetical protein